jgi:hypothetical protein
MRQVKASTDCWGLDWSAPSRNISAQLALATYINEYLRPEAITVLNTPIPVGTCEFRRRLEALRISSAKLHRSNCPSRRFRKLEYIAALEFGQNPRAAAAGRLHAHVLLYNLGSIRFEDLAQRWRELNHLKKVEEPLIHRYAPGPEGILYCLKALGSDVDMIYFSSKLSLHMSAAQQFCSD